MVKKKALYTPEQEWNFDALNRIHEACMLSAKNKLKLNPYELQIEIITSEQMLDAYASHGLPLMYNHWSFGKHFIQNEIPYKKGMRGLAYEIIINSNPSICYLMEENSITMQNLVIAHCLGHSHFFKNNGLFREWTDASSIIDYLVFAKSYISKCEEKYGLADVEDILDSCHAIMNYGVDRYRRPTKLSAAKEQEKQAEREKILQEQINDLWRTLPATGKDENAPAKNFPEQPEENILYFIEKTSPILEPWQREIVRIVRKIAQYFYPQRQSQLMNEGFATFTHYHIMNDLYENDLITDGSLQEFLHSHTNVVFQPTFDSNYYNGINPYGLGFSMYQDIKRICEEPTDEDKQWFPEIAGEPWLDVIQNIVTDYRDTSFVQQFLSPSLIRKWRFFDYKDYHDESHLIISKIHNERGYREIRKHLSEQYDLNSRQPDIQVYNVDLKGSRTLCLRHTMYNGIKLGKDTEEVLKHIRRLWGYGVELNSFDPKTGSTESSIQIGSMR